MKMKVEVTHRTANTISITVEFEERDFNEICSDYPSESFLDKYEQFHEYKVKTVHNLITSEIYRDKILDLTVKDQVYEFWQDFTVNPNLHNEDMSSCSFCTLGFDDIF